MFDRRLVLNFEWGLLFYTAVLAGIGVAMIYSAANAGFTGQPQIFHVKQGYWYGISVLVMLVIIMFSYKRLDRYAIAIYIACLLLLVAVLLVGKMGGGSRRWLGLGPLTLQPSELVKIAVILMLARHYSRTLKKTGLVLADLLMPMFIVLLPALLIVRQPDLGTALLLVLIAGTMTLFIKIERRTLLALMTFGIAAIPIGWLAIKEYQRQRILTFLNPDRDPLGAGYHIIQSKIAIGSGQFSGKGFLEGTQNALAFLPEQHTDFIFCVLAEEWGFMGAGSLILLFLGFLLYCLKIAYNCRDAFGTLLIVGLVALLFWEGAINMGMVMGLLPVVGMPLPFISYGGSSVLTIMIAVGLILNISSRRFIFE